MGLCPSTVGNIFKQFSNKKPRLGAEYFKVKIFQYDLSGNFLKEFPSAYEASIELNISYSSIGRVLKGKDIHAKKSFFLYEFLDKDFVAEIILNRRAEKSKKFRDAFKLRSLKPSLRKRVYNIHQYDKNGNFIKTWLDYKEIMDFFNLKNSCQISNALNGEKKHFRGFIWSLDYL